MKRNLTPLKDLNVLDDFLINAIVSDQKVGIPFCRKVLSVLLQRNIGELQIVGQKSIPGVIPGARGVRLDVEIIEPEPFIDGLSSTSIVVPNIYDFEPHLQKTNDYTRHNRYYQAKIDSRYLESGERNFNHLPNLYVISITDYDPFGYDQMIYTVQNHCNEVPSLNYDDGLKFIYFYTGGQNGGNKDIQNVLHYLADSRSEQVTDAATEELHSYVSHVKKMPEVNMGYMSMEDYVRYKARGWLEEETAEARLKGHAEGLAEGFEAGLTESRTKMVQAIADCLEKHGHIPQFLKDRLLDETSFNLLCTWLQIAARAESIEDFIRQIE